MTFAAGQYEHPQIQEHDPTIVVLEHSAGHRVEVWPGGGFNAFRWSVPGPDGQPLELLYADPGLFSDGRPTRSGIPVLFPFPNRIADGTFTWNGKPWLLPRNDPAQANAIHGFACRRPWALVTQGANDISAWVTGRYNSLEQGGEWSGSWPAAHQVTLTLRLTEDALRLEAEVANPDIRPLPFGLGYHPYFAIPFAPPFGAADCLVQVPAASYWELKESLPTGFVRPVDEARNLNAARSFEGLHLDDLLTGLPDGTSEGRLYLRGQVAGAPGFVLQVHADDSFREMVVFTPPHRQAFCIEPYTCPTDAINLTARGVECGWRVLAPGAAARFVVELRLLRGATLQPTPAAETSA